MSTRCQTCRKQISKTNWCKHIKTNIHKLKLEIKDANTRLRLAKELPFRKEKNIKRIFEIKHKPKRKKVDWQKELPNRNDIIHDDKNYRTEITEKLRNRSYMDVEIVPKIE